MREKIEARIKELENILNNKQYLIWQMENKLMTEKEQFAGISHRIDELREMLKNFGV